MKMKGDYEYLNITLALFIFMGTVVLIVLMVNSNMLSYSGRVTNLNEVTAIEASHMLSFCLATMEDGDSRNIPSALLDKYAGQDIATLCGIEKPPIKLKITDVETGKKWEFGGSVSGPGHEMWVSLAYDNAGVRTINMGKMNVEM